MGLKTSEHISTIAIDPRDSNVVWVAAQGPLWKDGGERGLYVTRDGGKTWTKAFETSPHTGVTEVLSIRAIRTSCSRRRTSAGAPCGR
jgi:hypothetical protein